jgi:hypothetical protein
VTAAASTCRADRERAGLVVPAGRADLVEFVVELLDVGDGTPRDYDRRERTGDECGGNRSRFCENRRPCPRLSPNRLFRLMRLTIP